MGTKYRDGVSYHGAFPAQVIQELVQDLCDMIYPVGCYFETTDTDFNPNDVFVGTWILEAEGLVHISSGTNYVVSANDKDGGEATINLQHSHTLAGYGRALIGRSSSALTTISYKTGGASSAGYKYDRQLATAPGISGVNTTPTDTSALEGGTSTELSNTQSVMPPYKIVNRWYRTE